MFKLVFSIALVCCQFHGVANNTIKLGVAHIPGVLEKGNPNAPYNKFLKLISDKTDVEFVYIFMPHNRVTKMMSEAKVHCIFPNLPVLDGSSRDSILSSQVNGVAAYFFTKSGKPIHNTASLDGKTVVHRQDYLFSNQLHRLKKINFVAVPTQKIALKMLLKERADAYLDYLPDIRFAFSKDEIALLSYDEQSPLFYTTDSFECKNTDVNRQFVDKVSSVIDEFHHSGVMKRLLQDFYFFVPNEEWTDLSKQQ